MTARMRIESRDFGLFFFSCCSTGTDKFRGLKRMVITLRFSPLHSRSIDSLCSDGQRYSMLSSIRTMVDYVRNLVRRKMLRIRPSSYRFELHKVATYPCHSVRFVRSYFECLGIAEVPHPRPNDSRRSRTYLRRGIRRIP